MTKHELYEVVRDRVETNRHTLTEQRTRLARGNAPIMTQQEHFMLDARTEEAKVILRLIASLD